MITIMGATGHTGSVTTNQLLDANQPVRVLGRSAERLQPFVKRGAKPAVGDATDAAFLTDAFRGATAVYALVPPDYGQADPFAYYDKVGAAVETAVKKTGVKRLVFLSSLGAERPAGCGLIGGLHRVEERFKKLEVSTVSLRAGFFMENFFGMLGMIKQQGIMGGATPPDVPISMVACHDIGVVAADELQKAGAPGFTTRELLGPRDYSMAEAARIIGQKIGKPDLQYVQFPDDGVKQAFMGMGFSPRAAELFVEMAKGIGSNVKTLEGRNVRNSTPMSLEQFAVKLGEAYRGI